MTLALNHISSELESGVLKTSSRAEFNVELIFHSDSAAIERWKSVLSKRGSTLFHSIEWMELLRAVYKLHFVVGELRAGERVLDALLMAHPYPRWMSNRLTALPFSDFCPPLEAEPRAATVLLEKLARRRDSSRLEVRGACASPPWQVSSTFQHREVDSEPFRRGLNKVLGTAFRREVRRGKEEALGQPLRA